MKQQLNSMTGANAGAPRQLPRRTRREKAMATEPGIDRLQWLGKKADDSRARP
jgi:hypothetical protein